MRGRRLMLGVLCVLAALPAHAFGHGVTHGDPRPPFTSPLLANASGVPLARGGWCGEVKAGDDTAHETGTPALPKLRAVEAVPSDRTPNAGHRDGIQASVAALSDHLAAESGGKRSLRFDLGTACGPQYVDILTIRLPKTAAVYGGGACNTGPLFDDLEPLLPQARGPRNTIIYAPSVDCGAIAGYATLPRDDRPGPANRTNAGGYMAVTFILEGRTALHEIGHNLGAVQESAPHSDLAGHCWDMDDTMCYPYTAFLPQSPLRPCAAAEMEPFDCGKDDYFNPSPAPGSYLATHWNTYDSVFMCELAQCAPAVPTTADDTTAAPPAAAPQPDAGAPAGQPAATPTPAPESNAEPAVAPAKKKKAKPKRAKRKPRCRTRRVRGRNVRKCAPRRSAKRR